LPGKKIRILIAKSRLGGPDRGLSGYRSDIIVIAGGIIPENDFPRLKKLGVAEIFLPSSSTRDIGHWSKVRKQHRKQKESISKYVISYWRQRPP